MPNEAGRNERRLLINYWDGVNAVVNKSIAKNQEPLHVENARSKIIGTLEKREGQTVLGTDKSGGYFSANENYGLAEVETGYLPVNGLYRFSDSSEGPTDNSPRIPSYSISISDLLTCSENYQQFVLSARQIVKTDGLLISESVTVAGLSTLTISITDTLALYDVGLVNYQNSKYFVQVSDQLTLSDPTFKGIADRYTLSIDNTYAQTVNIYRLDDSERWNGLSAADAQDIAAGNFTTTIIDGKLFLANGHDYNRYVDQDGQTVVTSRLFDSLAGPGSLYNSPRAKIINAYKSRLYLANYSYEGQRYGNTVLQSSQPLGILALLNDDVTGPTIDSTTTFPITDLTSYWKFDETSDGDATDITGQHNLSGPAHFTTDGKINNGLHFITTTDYKQTTDDLAPTSGYTMAAWAKLTDYTFGSIFRFASADSNTFINVQIGNSSGGSPVNPIGISAIAGGGGVSDMKYSTDFYWPLNTWYHFLVTWDGSSTITFYVNGVAIGTNQAGSASPVTDSYVKAGGGDASTSIVGVLDEMGFWNRVLTSTEIATVYNSGAGLSPDGTWTLPVTDTTYFYSDDFANEYEVWRIGQKIADVTINDVDDLNIYAPVSGVTWAPGETHGFQSQDQVYVAGTVTGPKVYRWPNNPTLGGSDIRQYNTFKLSGGDESDITMVENVGNVMLIANKSVMATWNDSILNYFDLGIGVPSFRGYTKAYGALYFVHYTGVYTSSGGMPNIISAAIQPYFDGATKEGIESAVVGKKGRSVFFAIGDVTLYNPDGSVKHQLSSVALEYNILQQNWYIHTNVDATAFETFIDQSASDRLAFTDDSTKDVKTFLEGDSDDGDEIFFRVDTQPLLLAANIEELATPELVITESERGSQMQTYVSIDDGPYYQLEGENEKGISRLRVKGQDEGRGSPVSAHYIAVSYRDSSKQRNKLARAAVTFVPGAGVNPP